MATVVVAPVVLERPSASIGKLNPVVTFDSKRYRVLMQEMAGIPRSRLGDVVASASGQREEFTAAADLLFTGI